MKHFNKYLITAALMIISQFCFSQQVRVSALAEKTVMGLQVGTEVGYRLKNNLTFSGFYQRNVRGVNEIKQRVYEYSGGALSLAVARCEKIMISAVVRGGLSNRRFVVVTPGVDTELKLTKMLSINLGMSLRAAEAAVSAKLTLTL